MLDRRAALASFALGSFALSAACRPALAQARLPVVASFSILGDFLAQVGGARTSVSTIVGPGGDAHVYTPTPADARTVASARLVVENGLGYEGWMSRLVAATRSKAVRATASRGVKTRIDKGEHGGLDPHAWQSVANARIYVANIRDALIAADGEGRAAYEANAGAYLKALDTLDAEIRAAIAPIPPDRRRIVTTHDAFGYFADAYGLSIAAPAGVSTESEISARDVARIVRQIRADKIPAVFLENVSDQRLIAQIARESGARVGGVLYSDSLSPPGGPAGTYIDMMRHNIRELTKALAP